MRRHLHRRHALKTVDQVGAAIAVQRLRAHPVLLLVTRLEAEARELSLARPVDDGRVERAGDDRPRLAAGPGAPLLGHAGAERERRHDERRVVLLSAVDPIGELVVHGHLIYLGGWLDILRTPGLPAIE